MTTHFDSVVLVLAGVFLSASSPANEEEQLFPSALNVNPPHISTDKSVKYDYDIVYVRAKRAGDKIHKRFYTDIAAPVYEEPGADLMLLHPDGSEELLVAGGEKGSVTDPMVSLDGEWVYYSLMHDVSRGNQHETPPGGADIYKIHVKSRKIVQLTNQQFDPNTGAGDWPKNGYRKEDEGKEYKQNYFSYGVYNMSPCPLPGGKIAFTSNRLGYRPSKGYPSVCLQLFVMDDDGKNAEHIGHLNIAGALHPVVLTGGQIMFSSLESQGVRSDISWGIWTIHPDGSNWGPLVSAFDPGGAANGFHFQTQLSDGSVIIEEYYNQNNSGFGAYIKLAYPRPYPAFGPARMDDARNKPLRFGRFDNGHGKWYRLPFMPTGAESFTPFTLNNEGPADPSVLTDKDSPKVGKFTHPSGAPDNHLLTIYSPGPVNHQYTFLPQLDGGIYLIKNGKPLDEPGQMLLIKNDPNFNEQWPRAVVPYKRIYGIAEPKHLAPLANDGKLSPHLPEGTPFGLVGTSSLYKRESYPNGVVPEGKVTATFAGGDDPWKGLDAFTSHGNGMPINWHNQGADAGLYSNDEIHAIRILVQEPTTDLNRGPKSGRLFLSHARERLRILGEIPVRKFLKHDGTKREGEAPAEPLDPDGNPDTSFLAKIPANTSFTFQTLDKNGMVLNMAQTWHQLRPGEIRNDCGGCHAHSQQATPFEKTFAARADYKIFDLTQRTPLLSSVAAGFSLRTEAPIKVAAPLASPRPAKRGEGQGEGPWDTANSTALRYITGPLNVEYNRDIKPILERSCVACHTQKWKEPAGNLVLDAPDEDFEGRKYPGAYYRLAMDERAKYGYKPVGYDSWGYPQASRYIRKLQSRRSVLVWKLFGRRLDGFSNDDHPSESPPGSGKLMWKGEPVSLEKYRSRDDLDYVGIQMPPPEACAGTYAAPDGSKIKVPPLSDEDRRTIVRWIDLGCPLDLDYDPAHPDARGYGWMCDDNRPTLTLTHPRAGANDSFSRILVGMCDAYSGLDMDSFSVTADFPMDGAPAGENLAGKFKPKSPGVWEMKFTKPVTSLRAGTLVVSVKDKQGNISRIEREFSVTSRIAGR